MAIFDNWRERRERRRNQRFFEDAIDVIAAARELADVGDNMDTLTAKLKKEFNFSDVDWDKLFALIEKILALILALV